MNFNFDNDRPIYIQLVEQLKLGIVSSDLEVGARLPSVRDFALIAKVNPNTMQKALTELEEQKLIYTERTNGKYVTNDTKLIEEIKNQLASTRVRVFMSDMQKLGISKVDAIRYLQGLEEEKDNGNT